MEEAVKKAIALLEELRDKTTPGKFKALRREIIRSFPTALKPKIIAIKYEEVKKKVTEQQENLSHKKEVTSSSQMDKGKQQQQNVNFAKKKHHVPRNRR